MSEEEKTYEQWLVEQYVARKWPDAASVRLLGVEPNGERMYAVNLEDGDGEVMLAVHNEQVVDIEEEWYYEELAAASRLVSIHGHEPLAFSAIHKPRHGSILVVRLSDRRVFSIPKAIWDAAETTDG